MCNDVFLNRFHFPFSILTKKIMEFARSPLQNQARGMKMVKKTHDQQKLPRKTLRRKNQFQKTSSRKSQFQKILRIKIQHQKTFKIKKLVHLPPLKTVLCSEMIMTIHTSPTGGIGTAVRLSENLRERLKFNFSLLFFLELFQWPTRQALVFPFLVALAAISHQCAVLHCTGV